MHVVQPGTDGKKGCDIKNVCIGVHTKGQVIPGKDKHHGDKLHPGGDLADDRGFDLQLQFIQEEDKNPQVEE